ncbi:hypothetical protein RHMOL_Rhmol13G0145000 [Rhododendron molle]|uniref:Uncharacterized protein n=1 Tax=Rhododendron molle TaxID=49168 RepID=A0ACC0L6S6_RHOML|nr:hypothetical protein RHMOL_Rhmol13G0145000 [Rhododendron molle]
MVARRRKKTEQSWERGSGEKEERARGGGNRVASPQVFDDFPDPYVHLWNAIIWVYFRHNLFSEAIEMYWRMQVCGVRPDCFTLPPVLKACSGFVAIEAGRVVHGQVFRHGFGSDMFLQNGLVDLYAKCGQVAQARVIFDGVYDKTIVSWTSIISGYAQNGQPVEALTIFSEMRKLDVKSDWIALVSILRAYTDIEDLEQRKSIHGCVIKMGLEFELDLCIGLTAMYAKCGHNDCPEEAMVILWNAMISGYAKNGCPEEAMELFRRMMSKNIRPNLITVISTILACAQVGSLEQARWMDNYVNNTSYRDDVYVSAALIDMYAKCGSVELARKVFNQTRDRDVVVWSAMIVGYGLHGCGEEAIDLFHKLKQAQVHPNDVTFIGLLTACNHSGLVQEGWKFFHKMKEYRIKPRHQHYACVVDLLGHAGYLDWAHDFIMKMPIEPGVTIWGALLSACKIYRHVILGEYAAEKLFSLDPLNTGHYVQLSNLYASARMWNGVAKVRVLMRERGLSKDTGYSMIEVNGKLQAFRMGDKSHPRAKEIKEELGTLERRINEAGFVPDTESVLHDNEDKEESFCNHSERLAIAYGLISTAPGITLRITKNLRARVNCHSATKILPSELVLHMKLQLLDAGNNSITSWSDLKALPSLVNLKNLNLQGNPVAEKDRLAKRVHLLGLLLSWNDAAIVSDIRALAGELKPSLVWFSRGGRETQKAMTVLSSKQVLEDNHTRDLSAITALTLTHKALTDVSCLSEFKNLERLDLSANNLTSLEGLRSCVNLKWLSVVQNKLQSLKGFEGLTKLTVLNAGKNKLKSMDEIRSLISLRALILNDNEIVTLCPLDQMKELNTLDVDTSVKPYLGGLCFWYNFRVLSRNPISKIGGSLNKVKSITKLSLSNCQLQSIDSLKSCTELKELRLAHNDIKTLPSELVVNMKLQLLDVGNNSITSWSDLKVLPSLVNLKNLNLQGNPAAEKDKLAKKIRKLAPNLQILNAKPIDKSTKNEKGDRDETVNDYSFTAAKQQGAQKEGKIEQSTTKQNPKHKRMSQTNDYQHDAATDVVIERGLRHKDRKTMGLLEENDTITEQKLNKKLKKVQENEVYVNDNKDVEFTNPFVEKKLKRKKDKASRILEAEAANENEDGIEMEKELKRKSKRAKRTEANVIDDGQTPFTDLFAITGENSENSAGGLDEKVVRDVSATVGLVTFPVKNKKIKNRANSSPLQLAPVAEVGLGGQSMWGDE